MKDLAIVAREENDERITEESVNEINDLDKVFEEDKTEKINKTKDTDKTEKTEEMEEKDKTAMEELKDTTTKMIDEPVKLMNSYANDVTRSRDTIIKEVEMAMTMKVLEEMVTEINDKPGKISDTNKKMDTTMKEVYKNIKEEEMVNTMNEMAKTNGKRMNSMMRKLEDPFVVNKTTLLAAEASVLRLKGGGPQGEKAPCCTENCPLIITSLCVVCGHNVCFLDSENVQGNDVCGHCTNYPQFSQDEIVFKNTGQGISDTVDISSVQSVLSSTFGHENFRSKQQEDAVHCLLKKEQDVFVSMPTGKAKICFWYSGVCDFMIHSNCLKEKNKSMELLPCLFRQWKVIGVSVTSCLISWSSCCGGISLNSSD